MILRPYQQACLDAVYAALQAGETRIAAHMDTGSGKTPTICALIQRTLDKDPSARILVLVDRKELVAQIAGTWKEVSGISPAIYAASLERRETGQVMVCQIQSVWDKPNTIGKRKLIIVDEAHAIPDEGDGMYLSLLRDLEVLNPKVRTVGFTATPFRLGLGRIYGEGRIFSRLVYSTDLKALVAEGFLSPLVGKNGARGQSFEGIRKAGGEYVAAAAQDFMSDEERVACAVHEIKTHSAERKHLLVFACGVKHAGIIRDALAGLGIAASVVTGDDDQGTRDATIRRFKAGAIRCLINVQVLTTGFDFPSIDMVVLLRPTMSPGLFSQMVGRGLRRAPGKTDCLVLDMGGNLERHGPVDEINKNVKEKRAYERAETVAPGRTCPKCFTVWPTTCATCATCGYAWHTVLARHDTLATSLAVLSDGAVVRDVDRVFWSVRPPRHMSQDGTSLVATLWMGLDTADIWFPVENPARSARAREMLTAWGADASCATLPAVQLCSWMQTNAPPPARALVKRGAGKWILLKAYNEPRQPTPAPT